MAIFNFIITIKVVKLVSNFQPTWMFAQAPWWAPPLKTTELERFPSMTKHERI